VVALVLLLALISPTLKDWYWHFYWDSNTKIVSVLPPACYSPSDTAVDGEATAIAQAWEDVNGDGKLSRNEPPLSGVVAMITPSGYQYDPNRSPLQLGFGSFDSFEITPPDGMVNLHLFMPGCICNCWQYNAVAVWPPEGYKSTTPGLVELSSSDQIILYGFQKISP
jgi:hypothetical protein